MHSGHLPRAVVGDHPDVTILLKNLSQHGGIDVPAVDQLTHELPFDKFMSPFVSGRKEPFRLQSVNRTLKACVVRAIRAVVISACRVFISCPVQALIRPLQERAAWINHSQTS
jgi:hypothetical protein